MYIKDKKGCPFNVGNLFLIIITFISYNVNAQTLKFRTDGYYLADNHCDTVYLLAKTKSTAPFRQEIISSGDTFSHINCVPEGEIPINGSSQFSILAFASNDDAMKFSYVCWDDAIKKEVINLIHKHRREKSVAKTSLLLNANNTFTFSILSQDKKTMQICGKLYSDKIVATTFYLFAHGVQFPGPTTTYLFYKFDQSPKGRKALYYVHRNPLN